MKKLALFLFAIVACYSVNARPSLDEENSIRQFAPASEDTVKAINNLFHRKRSGGQARGVILGAVTAAGVASGASGGEAGNFLIAGVAGVIAITGFTQSSNYSTERMEAIIENYKRGIAIPASIRKKLKKKDFK